MKAQIALITIITEHIQKLLRFYCDGLGFSLETNWGKYIELNRIGVRFALYKRSVMHDATGHPSFLLDKEGSLIRTRISSKHSRRCGLCL